ncbi:PD-(D/E)XK motif protein [Plantibacter sp. VKM Ac-2885]|uniref:PD-(D/E)XK family member n=1 Tax=Plantibacter elymi (nom. nud.) TaxID=199708 RepID=A0ABY1RFP5_9MICO|nr:MULTISPECIES: PD-(D/E)XK motif protein [unclassified Plantibacter]MBF4513628.1 PD-(D/E)XK motif protein [Plantibacter sp. VKM Ac-2885]SMQ73134.1 Putative PD-(D/E)XK family member [Plantibacter sp. VKM Ac-1784]
MPSLQLTTIKAAWEMLEIPTVSELVAFPLPVGGPDIRLAVDRRGGRHLLVQVQDDTVQVGPGTHLVEAVRSLAFAGGVHSYLDISVSDHRLMDEFDMLVLDVLNGPDLPSARRIHAALERWRTLFQILARRTMSREQLLGLAGELAMLRLLLERRPELVRAWRGPFGAPHDFVLEGGCFEVKSTTLDSKTVTIHGLEQLEPYPDRPLFLVVSVFEEVDFGPTMSELVDAVRDLACDRVAIDEALRQAGWSSSAPDLKFLARGTFVVRVSDLTPRLRPATSGGVPVGVVHADYKVDVERLESMSESLTLESILGDVLA